MLSASATAGTRARAGATLTISDDLGEQVIDLYSEAGLAAVSDLWTALSLHFRLMYQLKWLGIPIIQLPPDIIVLQELLWELQPDVVVECGVAHGGSLVLYASILELLGKGQVIGVDVEIRPHNRTAIESHPLAKRITLIEGSSIDPATVAAVGALCAGRRTIVLLDSNHTTEHVYAEILAYKDFVPEGSYLVVMDGAQALVADAPRGKPEWANSSPLHAIEQFLVESSEFEIDDTRTRFGITSSTRGFLRRTNTLSR